MGGRASAIRSDHDLADGAGGQRLVGVRVDYSKLEEIVEDLSGTTRQQRVRLGAKDRNVALGHAEALDDAQTEAFLERLAPFRRDRYRHHRAQLVVGVVRPRRLAEDEFRHHPQGIGHRGPAGANLVEPAVRAETFHRVHVGADDQGGGGYGNPLDREVARVLNDVAERYVSMKTARDVYGVVIEGDVADDSLAADTAATEKLRSEMRA